MRNAYCTFCNKEVTYFRLRAITYTVHATTARSYSLAVRLGVR